jgi:sarcosine oxidase delta subunit
VHNAGCRRWFNLLRDTATHRILAVYKIGEIPPGITDLRGGGP